MNEQPRAEAFGEAGGKFRESLVQYMAQAWGDRPSTAQYINHDQETERWEYPTSPAAEQAFKLGGTLEDAKLANQKWARDMLAQQVGMREAMTQQGMPPEQIAAQIKAAGLTDVHIAQICRKYAYELGKSASRDDPEREVEWHKKQVERAMKKRQQPMGGTEV